MIVGVKDIEQAEVRIHCTDVASEALLRDVGAKSYSTQPCDSG